MRFQKLIASILLTLLLCVSLTACNNSSMSNGTSNSGNTNNSSDNSGSSSNNSGNGTTSSGLGNAGGTSTMVQSNSVGSGTGSSNKADQPVSFQTGTLVNPTGNLENDIQAVVEKARPAVVLIVARGAQEEGAGTGSIVTPNGFIITNHHVIAPAAGRGGSITVVLDNGQKQSAQVTADVPDNDLAVLKIDGNNLPTIPLSSANSLKVGQWTVAIGNALALPGGPTVTAGIVSAIGRSIQEPQGASLTDLVQTSAAINPGNSGGPLLNLQGQMIGINTAAPVDPESQSAAQGIGFAINIDQAKAVIQQYANGNGAPAQTNNNNNSSNNGNVYVGVTTQDVTSAIAARYNLSVNQGAIIVQIAANSPAAKAGLQVGEVIVGIDGKQVASVNDIRSALRQHKVGDTIQLVVVTRSGQQGTVSVTLGSIS